MITVIGHDGGPLRPEARTALSRATLVAGAPRHLDVLPVPATAGRVDLTDVSAALDVIAGTVMSAQAGGYTPGSTATAADAYGAEIRSGDGPGFSPAASGAEADGAAGGVADARDAVPAERAYAVVVASGDPGFFGIVRALRARGAEPRVIPAVSSVALAFAALGLPWDDALVVSAHGRSPRRALAAALAHPKTAVLTAPGTAEPAYFIGALLSAGRRVHIAERLGMPDERVTEVTAGHAAADGSSESVGSAREDRHGREGPLTRDEPPAGGTPHGGGDPPAHRDPSMSEDPAAHVDQPGRQNPPGHGCRADARHADSGRGHVMDPNGVIASDPDRATGGRERRAGHPPAPDGRARDEAAYAHPNVLITYDPARAVSARGRLAGHQGAPDGWALPESAYDHRDGQVTKAEVRALALARLAPRPGVTVWDVGAGSGSVAVECARFGAYAIAVERDADQGVRVQANAARHGAYVQVVVGPAPEALAGLPDPDAVFVGGGDAAVLDAVLRRAPARVVVALASIDRVRPVRDALRAAGYATDGCQLQSGRLADLPNGSIRLDPANPVTLVWGGPQ